MLKVGLTGNIGVGKTVVAKIFAALGVPVYQADITARKFLETDGVMTELETHFGSGVIIDGKPDRKEIASIVFNDEKALRFLNSLIHPLVRADLNRWFTGNAHQPYVIYEAAILFESGFYRDFDRIITVIAPIEKIYLRLKERDNSDFIEVEKRMKHQWEQQRKTALSDYIIVNDDSRLVIPQILQIREDLLKKMVS
jgi:dephospho-CoA kinase